MFVMPEISVEKFMVADVIATSTTQNPGDLPDAEDCY